jgi:hypothetical protein
MAGFCTILKIFHQAVGRRLSGFNHPYVVLEMAAALITYRHRRLSS